MTAVLLGMVAAAMFLAAVGGLVFLLGPFVGQIIDDARRPKSHRLQRHADYRPGRRVA